MCDISRQGDQHISMLHMCIQKQLLCRPLRTTDGSCRCGRHLCVVSLCHSSLACPSRIFSCVSVTRTVLTMFLQGGMHAVCTLNALNSFASTLPSSLASILFTLALPISCSPPPRPHAHHPMLYMLEHHRPARTHLRIELAVSILVLGVEVLPCLGGLSADPDL